MYIKTLSKDASWTRKERLFLSISSRTSLIRESRKKTDRHDSNLALFYHRIKKRKNHKVAVVATYIPQRKCKAS